MRTGLRVFAFLLAALCAACVQTPEQQAAQARADAEALHGARVHTELAAAWYSQRRFDIALEESKLALESLPEYVPAHNMRGLVYMEIGEPARARAAFERALELKPGDAETNNNFGWFLCNNEQPRESIAHFMRALEDRLYQSPDKPLVNAGICTRKLGDNARAEGYFRRALLLRPDHPQAHFHLGDMAFKRADLRLAQKHVDEAMAASGAGASAELLWLKLRLERKRGDRGAEASTALQLRRRYPQSRETLLLMKGAYE